MPVSRPILIAVAGALLALVAFYASSAMRSGEKSSTPAAKPPETSAPKAAKPDVAKNAPASKNAPATKQQQAKAAKPKPARTAAGVPARVERAVKSGRNVVLFFYQRGGADDSATADSVAALRGRRGVSVFTAPVSRLSDFRAITGSLGISQAPAVVIVGRKGQTRKARVVEGFIDSKTLAQEVADSR